MSLYMNTEGFLAAESMDDIQLGAIVTANGTAIGRIVNITNQTMGPIKAGRSVVAEKFRVWKGGVLTTVQMELTPGAGFAVGNAMMSRGVVELVVQHVEAPARPRRPNRYALALKGAI